MEPTDVTTQQLMFSLIEIWKGSGKSQQEFCRDKDIAYSKFYYWLKKYNAKESTLNTASDFIPVTIKNGLGVRGSGLELVYPDGRRLIFHQDVDPSFLRALLA